MRRTAAVTAPPRGIRTRPRRSITTVPRGGSSTVKGGGVVVIVSPIELAASGSPTQRSHATEARPATGGFEAGPAATAPVVNGAERQQRRRRARPPPTPPGPYWRRTRA